MAPFTQHILSAALAAAAPPSERTPPDAFESQLDQVELIRGGDDAQIISYDSAGEVIGTIAIWVEANGDIHLASDYGDGYAETVVVDGRTRTAASLPPEVVATRAERILDRIMVDGGHDAQESKFACAVAVIGATYSCATFSPACPFAAYGAACACLPLVMEDFQCGGKK